MEKSRDAFRTISEVAEFLDTPAHVLRFWESRFPQVRPVKRAGGRRYYRPTDVALLAGIKQLLHTDGLTIRGVQKVLREHGIRHVMALAGGTAALDAVDAVEPLDLTAADLTEPDAVPEQAESLSAEPRKVEATVLILGAAAAPKVEPPDEDAAARATEQSIQDILSASENVVETPRAVPEPAPEPMLKPEPGPETGPPPETEDDTASDPEWLPARLRALAPGALNGCAVQVDDIADRLAALRARMAAAARGPGH